MKMTRLVLISISWVIALPVAVRAESLVEKQFALFDINRDGGITQREITEAASHLGLNLSASQAQDLMIQADTNKDKSIDLAEFKVLAESIQNQS